MPLYLFIHYFQEKKLQKILYTKFSKTRHTTALSRQSDLSTMTFSNEYSEKLLFFPGLHHPHLLLEQKGLTFLKHYPKPRDLPFVCCLKSYCLCSKTALLLLQETIAHYCKRKKTSVHHMGRKRYMHKIDFFQNLPKAASVCQQLS